jgi:hypothetical protein
VLEARFLIVETLGEYLRVRATSWICNSVAHDFATGLFYRAVEGYLDEESGRISCLER